MLTCPVEGEGGMEKGALGRRKVVEAFWLIGFPVILAALVIGALYLLAMWRTV